MSTQVQRALADIKMRTGAGQQHIRMRTGACSCGCPTCPAGVTNQQDLPRSLGRQSPGQDGHCQFTMLELVSDGTVAADSAWHTVTMNSPIAMCVENTLVPSFVATTVEGWLLKNFTLGNRPQWVVEGVYASELFHPDSRCACDLPGDCVQVGTRISVQVQNRDSAAATFRMYLRGPAIF